MKKVLLSSLLACALFGAEQNYIEIGAGVIDYKDNFSTQSKKSISSLGSAESEVEAFPYVSFYYGYDLNESINLYATSEMGSLNIGSSFDTKYGQFDIGLKGSVEDEWKNPFLTGANRKITNTKEFGGYIGYSTSLFENLDSTFRYEVSKKSYDKDEVLKNLKRDGIRHILAVSHMYNTKLFGKKSTLISNFSYEKYDADGKQSSYNQYGVELGISSEVMENTNLFLLGSLGKKSYEKTNSEVNKKVDIDTYGLVAGIRVDKPFNYQNTYVDFKTGYKKEEANANFYDKEGTFGILSVGYNF